MEYTEVIGSKNSVVKIEPKEDIVEIGIDDILSSSEEETFPEFFSALANINYIKKINDIEINNNHSQIEKEIGDELLGNKEEIQRMYGLPKEENTVEIGIDDIFNSSDDESDSNDLDLKNNNVEKKEIIAYNTSENVYGTKVDIDNQIKEETLENEEKHIIDDEEIDDFSAVNNVQDGEKLVLNFAKNLEGVHKRGKSCKNPKETNWADIYKTQHITNCQEDIKKVTVIEAPRAAVIIKPHEFTRLDRHKFVCNHCQRTFKKLSILSRHIRSLHRDLTEMYYCPYCPFKSKWDLTNHIILKHKREEEIAWFRCHVCDMKFKTKQMITKHIYTHLSPVQLGELMKPCSICQRAFKTAATLKNHIRFVHNKELKKKHKCKQCEYTIVGAKNIKKHVEVYHSNLHHRRTYKCEKCDYRSSHGHQLKNHSKTHTPQYFCEKCAFIAPTFANLKLHQFTHKSKIDERDLKYRCDKCDYKTYRHYSFNIHKLNHLKPDEIQYFYCYHCNFKAKRKDNLKTHVLKHFKKEEVALQCFMCDFSTTKRNLLSSHLETHLKARNQENSL